MELTTDYIEPAELTGYVRDALADFQQNQFTLSRFLPNSPIDDLQYRFTSGGEGLIEAATFRNFDTPAPFGERRGAQRVSGELPPISRQLRLSEYDRLRIRRASDDAVVNAIFNDAETLVRQISARMELARGEALVTGKVAIDENGVLATADFGRDASHTVAAAVAWSDTVNADVLTDYESWVDTYKASNGQPPVITETSTKVIRLMQRNSGVIAAVTGSNAGRTRVTLAELNELLESEGLPPVEANDAQVTVNKVATRIIPDDQFVMLPEPGDPNDPAGNQLGATLLGTTSEALEPEYGIEEDEQPGIVAGSYKSADPVALFTRAAAIGLPVLANPNLTFAADVL